MEDPYELLGIDKKASSEEIKKAYRQKSIEYHPDKNKDEGASEMFKKISDAKNLLNDQERRNAYDEDGYPGVEEYDKKMEFLNNLHRHQTMRKCPPVETALPLTLADIYNCVHKTVKVDIKHINDAGEEMVEEKEIPIPVSTNFEFGKTFCVRGEGNTAPDHIDGDVMVAIFEEHDPDVDRLTIDGYDLVYEQKLSLEEVLCGFEFAVRHPNGTTYRFKCNKAVGDDGENRLICDGYGLKLLNQHGRRTHGNLIIKNSFDFSVLNNLNDEQRSELGAVLSKYEETKKPERVIPEDAEDLEFSQHVDHQHPEIGGIPIELLMGMGLDGHGHSHGHSRPGSREGGPQRRSGGRTTIRIVRN